jgi:hypothetical protein
MVCATKTVSTRRNVHKKLARRSRHEKCRLAWNYCKWYLNSTAANKRKWLMDNIWISTYNPKPWWRPPLCWCRWCWWWWWCPSMDPPANTDIKETINTTHYCEIQPISYTYMKQEFASNFKKYKQQSTQISGILLLLVSLSRTTRSIYFNSNKSPTRCKNFSFYYPDVYLQLNMFWAFSRPSSGAQWLQRQPLVLPS